jgi:hypothetical protein
VQHQAAIDVPHDFAGRALIRFLTCYRHRDSFASVAHLPLIAAGLKDPIGPNRSGVRPIRER